MQIIVLGMHRAGTSAFTRLINLMGAYLAPEDQFLPATPDNPKGYWERIDVLQLHEFLLEKLDADWYLTSTVDLSRINDELAQTFRQRAWKILQGLESHRPWVMKDPRLCLLLPLWLPMLEVPICVHVVRHPLATAHSLAKRDSFPLHFGMALWEQYNARALAVSAGLPRFSMCYETLMERPLETVKALYEQLQICGVQPLRLPADREILAFLKSDLQHHRTPDKPDSSWLTPTQMWLWEALKNSDLELDPTCLASSSRTLLLGDYENLLRDRRTLYERDTQLATAQKQLATAQEQLTTAHKQLITYQLTIEQKEAALEKSSAKNAADLNTLSRFFESLYQDTQIAFTSLTWRTGFAIAEAGRKLRLLPKTPMVQNHIAQTAKAYQAWCQRHSRTGFLTDAEFNEEFYLAQYPDVRLAIELGEYSSGYEHFTLRGREEIANGTRPYVSRLSTHKNGHRQQTIDREQACKEIARWRQQPQISIIMPVYNVDSRWLTAAIQSVMQQFYSNWELCIADDCSTRPETLAVLRQIVEPRCKVVFLETNQGIAEASNAALALANGEYIAFLDHDDEITPDALYYTVKAINDHNPDLLYSDEDKVSLDGHFEDPHFKPDYSPDLILSINYICHLSIYRKSVLDKAGSFRTGFDGSQDHDLILRVLDHAQKIHHIPRVLYHWRKIPGSTAAKYDSKNYAWEAGRRAIEETLQRRGIDGQVLLGQHPGTYRVKRALKKQPLISVIIPFRDHPELLRQCLDSILEKTTYQNLEILGISNGSVDPQTFKVMEHYRVADQRIRFLQHDIPFNYAAINNFATSQANGEHLLLLNNDITIITPDWVEALLEHSQRPEVGAVGAKLYYPDDSIQHGGVIIGIGGIAGHSHKYAQRQESGYFARLHLIQNLSAVTAACLMIKKALYQTIGGLDEQNLAIAFNDVDFCLRLREKGYLNIFTPYCELYHHESKTRGHEDTPQKKQRFAREIAYMRKRHATILRDGDPYYNVNLPLDRENFGML